MTAIALITILATIMSVEDGLARLDRGLMSGLRLGDTGAIFYEVPVGGEVHRVKVSRGTIIDVDEFSALLEVEPEFRVQAGYTVEFEVPAERIEPQSVLELTRTRLRARRGEPAVVRDLLERILPEDEVVEGHLWRLLDERRIARGQRPLVRGRAHRDLEAVAASRVAAIEADNETLRQRVADLERERDALAADLAATRQVAADREPVAVASPLPAARVETPLPAPRLVDRVMDWSQAWSDQRVDDYLDFYASTFEPPDGLDRAVWEAERRRRIESPRLINVALSQVEAQRLGDDLAQAMFFQDYRSTGYNDRVFKRLTLVREDGAWKIAREDVVDVDQPFDTAESLGWTVRDVVAFGANTGDAGDAGADSAPGGNGDTSMVTTAPPAAPATAPAPAPMATMAPEDPAAVAARVRAWAAAWSEQRVDDYLAAYASTFRPGQGLSREEWAARRRARLLAPSSIEVRLDNLRVEIDGDGRATARFAQSYRSDRYRDVVLKRLDLVVEDGSWKIARETVGE